MNIQEWMANFGYWGEVLQILLIWVIIAFINKAINTVVDRVSALPHMSANRGAIYKLLAPIGRYLLYIVGGLFTLQILNISITPLLAIGSAAGVAVGLGAQGVIKDIFAGFLILGEDKYVIGDMVRLEGYEGVVQDISLLSTTLRNALTGEIYSIPNGKIDIITNYSRSDAFAIVDIPVSYTHDINESIQILHKIFDGVTITNMISDVNIHGVQSLSDSAIIIRISAKCNSGTQGDVQRELRRIALEGFSKHGIEIPYQTHTVHVVK